MAARNESQTAIEASLTPEQKQAFQELIDDYKAASSEHVPGYRGGGIARKIAAALVQNGWRKSRAN